MRVIVDTILNSWNPVMYFCIVYTVLIFILSQMLFFIGGESIRGLNSLTGAGLAVLDILIGAFDSEPLRQTYGMGGILMLGIYYVINILLNWVLLNVFITIVCAQYGKEEGTAEAHQEQTIKTECGTPQHGLSPNKMSLITSDCGEMRSPSIERP